MAVSPNRRWLWWSLAAMGITAVVLLAVFRPQWFGKIGKIFGHAVANPHGWVG